jgi:hypothetical protein
MVPSSPAGIRHPGMTFSVQPGQQRGEVVADVVADLEIGRATAVQASIGQGAGWDVQEVADLMWREDYRDPCVRAGLVSHAGQVCDGYRDVPDRFGCTRKVSGKIWRRQPIRGESGHQSGRMDHRW